MPDKPLELENSLTSSSISTGGTLEIIDVSQKSGLNWFSFKLSLANLLTWLKSKLRPYKVYTIGINQSGTDAPTVNENENTIGAATWAYITSGKYNAVFPAGSFPDPTKVRFFFTWNFGAGIVPFAGQYKLQPNLAVVDDSTIQLQIWLADVPCDDVLTDGTLEARVYS